MRGLWSQQTMGQVQDIATRLKQTTIDIFIEYRDRKSDVVFIK